MAFRTFERRTAAPDVAAGWLRDRRPRSRGLRVHRSPRVRRAATLAGAAARTDRLRRLSVSMLLRVCRQPAAHQPRPADRRRSAHRGHLKVACAGPPTSRPPQAAHRQRGLPRRHRPSPIALAARARSIRRRRREPDARSLRALLPRRRRTGWTTSRCSWRSRRHTVTRRGPRGSGHRASRSGGDREMVQRAARARSGCTSSRSFCSSSSGSASATPATRDRFRSWATCRSSSRTTAPTSGRRQELFRLDDDGQPSVLAGVPPGLLQRDRSAVGKPALPTGTCFARAGYAWWVERFRALLTLVDAVRIDHFRGFEASWEVPARLHDGHARRVGEGPGRGALRRGADPR